MKYLSLLLLLLLPALPAAAAAKTVDLDNVINKRLLRIEVDNDILWSKDSNYSNGWSIQYHSKLFSSWDDAEVTTFSRWIGNTIPTLNDNDSIVRIGQGIGQIMMTPDDINNPEPPEGELPYAGTLTYSINYQSFNSDSAGMFQISAGIMGEESLAGDIQEFLHNDLDWGDEVNGWDSQRDTEPIVNLAYQYLSNLVVKGNFTNDWAGQLYGGSTLFLGNLTTGAEILTGIRFGWNMKEGFNTFQAPPGIGLYKASLIPKSEHSSPHAFDCTIGVRGMGLAYTVLYDGSFITSDDREVDREDFVASLFFGITYSYDDKVSVRFSGIKSSDILITDSLPEPRPGRNKTTADNSFGSIMIDFHL